MNILLVLASMAWLSTSITRGFARTVARLLVGAAVTVSVTALFVLHLIARAVGSLHP